MAQFQNDTDALEFEEHLLYELQTLNYTSQRLATPNQADNNAFIESYALHLRNWKDFFYPGPKQKRDDVTYVDFVDRSTNPPWSPPPLSPTLKTAAEMANKQIAHLTTQRFKGRDTRKTWESNWAMEIHALLRGFAQYSSPGRLSPRLRAAFLKAEGVLPVSGNTAPVSR